MKLRLSYTMILKKQTKRYSPDELNNKQHLYQVYAWHVEDTKL